VKVYYWRPVVDSVTGRGADWTPFNQSIDYESIINIRPSQNNRSMIIQDPAIRERVKKIRDTAETDYYTRLPVDYATTGQALYNWLDKSDRLLANALNQPHPPRVDNCDRHFGGTSSSALGTATR
jgi:hypothetical protein